MNQFESHPYFQRDSLVKFCRKHGICATAHTPLGGSVANTELFGSDSCLDEPIRKVSSLKFTLHTLPESVHLDELSFIGLFSLFCVLHIKSTDDTLKQYILFYDENKLKQIGEFIKDE